MADLTIAQRVHAGAAWLDEHMPGWWHAIDLDTLAIQSSCNCVLGQLYGDYIDSPDAARWRNHAYLADVRGFASLGTFRSRDAKADDYAALTEAWRTLIEERRSGVPA